MFAFTEKDLEKYDKITPPFGEIGHPTFKRTYSREVRQGDVVLDRESWKLTCKRVIEGSVNLYPEDPTATREWALEAFDMMYHMAWLPPGRGMWMMGTEYQKKRGGDALVNCWYTSVRPQSYEDMEMFEETYHFSHPTEDMVSFPFVFMFDRAMLGGGVGFGISKENINLIPSISTRVNLKVILDESHPDWERIVGSEEWSRISNTVVKDQSDVLNYEYVDITDDREGWNVAVRECIDAHFFSTSEETVNLAIDMSGVREYGADIVGFGGTASGPLPLIVALDDINNIINGRINSNLTSTDCLDIMNILGRCVVSGNVRRTAQIALGDADDKEYTEAKNYMLVAPIIDFSYGEYGWYTNEWGRKVQKTKPRDQVVVELFEKHIEGNRLDIENDLTEKDIKSLWDQCEDKADHLFDIFQKQDNHRWASNNSVYTNEMFDDYHFIASGIIANGEPGVANMWLMQNFGRIVDGYKEAIDGDVEGMNPCGEIPLENSEPCNLVEVVPFMCEKGGYSIDRALEIATQYSYRITFAKYMWPATQRTIEKNRRIGVSLTGVQDYFLSHHGHYAVVGWDTDSKGNKDITKPIYDQHIVEELDHWYRVVKETNEEHARLIGGNPSIKLTTNKPSGTAAKLPGVSSGIHWHYAPYMIQRMRFHESDPNLKVLEACGYPIEKAIKEPNTIVVQFPTKNNMSDHPNFKSAGNVTLEEQFANQALFCAVWADNAVSATLNFQQDEVGKIEKLLKAYSNRIKSTSLLPYSGHGYQQPPWEPISREKYEEMVGNIKYDINDMYKNMSLVSEAREDILEDDCAGGSCPIR